MVISSGVGFGGRWERRGEEMGRIGDESAGDGIIGEDMRLGRVG